MKGVRYFTPNMETQPAFGEALKRAKEQGVHVLAYDCKVGKDSIEIGKEVPVLLEDENLKKIADPLVEWYRRIKENFRGENRSVPIVCGCQRLCCSRQEWRR